MSEAKAKSAPTPTGPYGRRAALNKEQASTDVHTAHSLSM